MNFKLILGSSSFFLWLDDYEGWEKWIEKDERNGHGTILDVENGRL